MKTDTRTSIIVLAYNEEDNIGPVLSELSVWLDAGNLDAQIVVVDDGSTDRTADVARESLKNRDGLVVSHERNRGMGAGIKTGALHAGREYITFLPADGQIPPAALEALWNARDRSPDLDVVFSVYEGRDDGLLRKVLSHGVRALIGLVHGVRVKSDGPYLIRRSLLDPGQLTPDTFFLNFEVPVRAHTAGLRSEVVVVECRPRMSGSSKAASPRRALAIAQDLLELRRRRLREDLRIWTS